MSEHPTETGLVRVPYAAPSSNDRMQTHWLDIDKLSQPHLSPRKYNRKDVRTAVAIVRRFGVLLPIMATSDGQVLAHFVAVLAARELGYKQFPVLLVEHLSEPDQVALSIALSRFYELGKFDQKMLGEALLEIEVQIPDV